MSNRALGIDHAVARLLTLGTYTSIALLAAGLAAMLVSGTSPLDPGPRLDAGRLAADVVALRPAALLWLGIIVVVATPSARVAASLVGYVRQRDRAMTIVALAILGVITLSVVLAGSAE
jgi:uncharacterized membrane protein